MFLTLVRYGFTLSTESHPAVDGESSSVIEKASWVMPNSVAIETSAPRNKSPRIRVETQLRSWLDRGELRPGDALPPERELSARLDVNRNAVRWALSMLQREGRIEAKGPRTRVVSAQVKTEPDANSIMRDTIVIIGVLNESVTLSPDPRNHVWPEAVEDNARREIGSVGLHFMSLHPKKLHGQTIAHLVKSHPRGLIIPDLYDVNEDFVKAIHDLSDMRLKVVVYGGRPEYDDLDRIASDHESGAYELTKWLLAQGRRRIAMFFHHAPDLYWVRSRRAGYERAMREAGLEPLDTIHFEACPFPPELTEEYFKKASRHMVGYLVDHVSTLGGNEPVDALMLESDGLAYPVASACRLLGRTPGSDVLIAGYDGYGMTSWERQFEPCGPQVTMDKCHPEIGKALVRLLMDRVAGKLPEQSVMRAIKPRLVVLDERFAGTEVADSVGEVLSQ